MAEITRTLATLYQPGDVVEMRIPKTKRDGTVSGYFDDHQALAKALAENALESLTRLIEHFNNPNTPYEVKRRASKAFDTAYRYDPYEQLARVKEWAILAADEDAP